jgi:hypothetical protein
LRRKGSDRSFNFLESLWAHGFLYSTQGWGEPPRPQLGSGAA